MDKYEFSLDYLYDWGLNKKKNEYNIKNKINNNNNNNILHIKECGNKNTIIDNNDSNNAVDNKNVSIPKKKRINTRSIFIK